MLSAEPSDAVIADLITQPMIEALRTYDEEGIETEIIVKIIKAIPARRYVGIAQTYGLIPRDPTMFVADVLGRLGEAERQIREHKHSDFDGHTIPPSPRD